MNNYFVREQRAGWKASSVRKMIIEKLEMIGWTLVAEVDDSLVFGKEEEGPMDLSYNGSGDVPVACRIERDGPMVYVYDERSDLVDAYIDPDRLPVRVEGSTVMAYCTKQDDHVEAGHDVTCVPPADPDNPALRLLRAVYGLCPECDQREPHSHDH